MKILQIIQRSQLRGAEIFACQLSEQLIKTGAEVDVLVMFGKQSSVLPFTLPFQYLQANEKSRWLDFDGYKRLSEFIKKGNYDIVQANAGDTLKYATLSKKIFGWKSKLIFRNANKISDFLKSKPKLILNKWLMKELNGVASVSEECKLDFISTFSWNKKPIQCLPIGVKNNNVKPYTSLKEIGISGEGPFLLNVAGFVKEKNHEGLIRIFKKLLPTYPEAKLILIGEGKLQTHIKEIIQQNKITEKVFFLGKRKDVLEIMGCCDLFVLPSLIEGLPGVILESFSMKLPVVSYNVGGIKEIVINNKTGWLIEKNQEVVFLSAIKNALQNAETAIKEDAYKLATVQYSIENITEKFSAFYKIVASQF